MGRNLVHKMTVKVFHTPAVYTAQMKMTVAVVTLLYIKAVSYTHLDVYKRQLFFFPVK